MPVVQIDASGLDLHGIVVPSWNADVLVPASELSDRQIVLADREPRLQQPLS